MTRPEPLVQPLQIGELKCHAIQAGGQRLDGGAMFGNAPRALWSRWAQPDDANRITLACPVPRYDGTRREETRAAHARAAPPRG